MSIQPKEEQCRQEEDEVNYTEPTPFDEKYEAEQCGYHTFPKFITVNECK